MEVTMTIASEKRMRGGELLRHGISSAVFHESSCARCGGLMVDDFCMDLLHSTGDLKLAAKRCVQCGEVVDPVIQRNRQLRQESITVRQVETMSKHNL